MTIGLLTNIISPHQLPLAKAIAARIGAENYRYVYTEDFHAERANLGWSDRVDGLRAEKLSAEGRRWLEQADLVYSEERDLDLFNSRLAAGRATIYVSERWFRPPFGWFRLLHPRFFLMAARMVDCLRSPMFYYFPQGVHAWNDMRRLCRLLGFWNCEPRFRMWGYFVDSSAFARASHSTTHHPDPLRILWVGRFLRLKRVDTLIRAVAEANKYFNFALTLVGDGPEKERLEQLAAALQLRTPTVVFRSHVPIAEVRNLMHAHDIYVFPSDSREGWGAVVSEALEEGMMVLGSREAGASATILPATHLFHAGDWRRLAESLRQVAEGKLQRIPIGDWTAAKAAERMVEMTK